MDKRFRQIVLAAGALTIIVELVMWFYIPEDEVYLNLWSYDGYGALIDGGLPIYFLLIAVRFLILIGLYSFSSAARTLFLFYVPIIALATLAWGWRVVPPIIGPFVTLEIVADGLILGLAYYSPVAQKFRESAF